jgi:hypothetical protein
MHLRLSSYFTTLVLLVAATVLIQSPRLGVAFLAASSAVTLPLYISRVPRRFFYILLFSAAAMWVTHLARVPFLLAMPESFLYPRIGSVTPDVLGTALLMYAGHAMLFLGGLAIGLRLFGTRHRISTTPPPRRPLLVRISALVAVVCLLLFFARAYLQLALGLYTKNVARPSVGFIGELIPAALFYPLVILYLAKYRRLIPPFEIGVFALIGVGMVALVLLSGSRSAFATIGLGLFIYFLAHKGDFRLALGRTIAIGVAGASLLMLSFAVARPIRGFLGQNEGYAAGLSEAVTRGIRAAFSPGAATFLAGAVSRRVSLGMDGMLVVEMEQPRALLDAFRPLTTAKRVLGKLIPLYSSGDGGMSTGKAIAVAYLGHSEEQRHASSLGLFASLELMFGRYGSLAVAFVIALLWAAFFGLTARATDADVAYLLHFVGMSQVFAWILSGNIDGLLGSSVRTWILYAVYAVAIVVMIGAAKRERRERGIALARS